MSFETGQQSRFSHVGCLKRTQSAHSQSQPGEFVFDPGNRLQKATFEHLIRVSALLNRTRCVVLSRVNRSPRDPPMGV